jgi:hypothetical protein
MSHATTQKRAGATGAACKPTEQPWFAMRLDTTASGLRDCWGRGETIVFDPASFLRTFDSRGEKLPPRARTLRRNQA